MQHSGKRDRDGFVLRGGQGSRLEAFVDASFAFAMTLLVIFFNQLPETVAELRHALLRVPTFVVCFVLLASFWIGHRRFSRRFGLETPFATALSLGLVLVVLVFVYPLRMVISAFLSSISGGALPSELGIDPARIALDMQTAFIVYSVGVGLLSLILWRLNRHAVQHAEALRLDAREHCLLQGEIGVHCILALLAAISIVFSLMLIAADSDSSLLNSLPMWVYAFSGVLLPWHWARVTRELEALEAGQEHQPESPT
ncbi:TMEM175 family protein [Luteimonas sp. e5]